MNISRRLYRAFVRMVAPKRRAALRSLFRLSQVALAAFVLVLVVNIAFNQDGFGVWGDFFGGVLNPIFTLLTFAGVLITIVLQQTELRESRLEFKRSADALQEQNKSIQRQNFESTFFQMLGVHTAIVNAIDLVDDKNVITKGRDCFNVFYTRLSRLYRDRVEKEEGRELDEQILRHAYRTFWNKHQVELGHYFRYLYNIVRYVDESPYVGGPYIRLVRAQLSDQETLLLFYNCVASEYGEKFKVLAERFSLLDNMPQKRVFEASHLKLIDEKALGSPNGDPG